MGCCNLPYKIMTLEDLKTEPEETIIVEVIKPHKNLPEPGTYYLEEVSHLTNLDFLAKHKYLRYLKVEKPPTVQEFVEDEY